MKYTFPKVSIIIPTKNEELNIKRCLDSINKLNWPKNKIEIIVADGISTDNTIKIAKKYRNVKIISNLKQTVAPARNLAFKICTGEIIAFTDADCCPDSKWLKNCISYFEDIKVVGVGGPNITPSDETFFGKAISWVFNQKIFNAGSLHGCILDKVVDTLSLPGCNSIYKRKILEKVMPQNENLLTCDETEMNYRINDLGYKLLYTPSVLVYHYRRQTPKNLFKQMYRYSIGRLQLGKLRNNGMNITHVLIGLSIPLFIFINIIIFNSSSKGFIILILAFVMVLGLTFLISLIKNKNLLISYYSILIVLIITSAWSIGFLKELFDPIKNTFGK